MQATACCSLSSEEREPVRAVPVRARPAPAAVRARELVRAVPVRALPAPAAVLVQVQVPEAREPPLPASRAAS